MFVLAFNFKVWFAATSDTQLYRLYEACTCIYNKYAHTHTHTHTYRKQNTYMRFYIYIYREREREKDRYAVHVCIHVHTCIYVHFLMCV